MATDISIAISAKDNYTDAIKKMQTINGSFGKSLDQMQGKLEMISKQKITLKTDLTKAKRELSEAEKAFKKTGDEASKLQLQAAQANYDNIKQNLDMVSRAAKQTSRDMDNMVGISSKAENQMGGKGGVFSTLAKAGMYNMAGQAVAGLGSMMATSALGGEAGGAVNSIMGGAVSGAAMGSIAGPAGAAIGAAIGGISGAINALTATMQKRDEAFQNVVQDQYGAVKDKQANMLSSGSALAGTRETDLVAFSTLFGGRDVASGFLDELKDFANVTPFLYDDLTGMSKVLKTYGYEVEDILPTLQKIGDAGAALGMEKADMQNVATYLGRMKTTNKANLEYINPLLERGIPVYDYLAESMGKTKDEAIEMLNKGLIPGAEAADAILNAMGTNFAGSMEEQSKTYEGLLSTLTGLQQNMDAAMGAGFNDARKGGMREQIDWLSGASGDRMQDAYGYIGAFQAELENEKERMLREHMDAAMGTDEFVNADAATKGQMLMQAQVDAQAEYLASDGYQTQLAADIALVNGTQEAMAPVYQNAGYLLGKEFEKGLASVKGDIISNFMDINGMVSDAPHSDVVDRYRNHYLGNNGVTGKQNSGPVSGRAYGLSRVPYDGFLAALHEGERVQTAAQARREDAKATGGVMITGNTFTVREEADIDRVATQLFQKIQSAQASYIGKG